MKVKILYGTEVGTTKYVAELLQKKFNQAGWEVDLQDVGRSKNKPQLDDYQLLLVGSPTYYNGQLVASMAEFLSNYAPNLQLISTAVFSLGDSQYSHFCGSAEILETWVAERGGKIVGQALKIDGYPSDTTAIDEWVNALLKSVN